MCTCARATTEYTFLQARFIRIDSTKEKIIDLHVTYALYVYRLNALSSLL